MAIGKPAESRVGAKEFLFTILTVLAVLGAIAYFATVPKLPEHRLVGKPAPPLDFSLPSGKKATLDAQKGKVVLLNFWAGWCEPCLEEMPSLRMMESHFANDPFMLLAFDIDEGEDTIRGKVPAGEAPSNLIFQFSRSGLRAYGIQYIPISVLIDRQGIVRRVFSGPRNWMDLDLLGEIRQMLRE